MDLVLELTQFSIIEKVNRCCWRFRRSSITGIIEGQGAPITGDEFVSGGTGYSVTGTVPTVALTGSVQEQHILLQQI